MVERFEYRYDNDVRNSEDVWNNNEQITSSDFNKSINNINLSSDAIEWINFWYISNQQKNERLMYQFNQDAEWNNSVEWQLMQNEQIQLLLSEILSDYKNYIWTDKDRLKILINKEKAVLEEQWKQFNEDQSKIIESMYQYMLENDNELWFENFIITNSIHTIKTYLSNHVDENWKISYISKNEIKARLKIDWFINLYKWYREEHTESSDALSKLEQELLQFTNAASYVKNSIDFWIQQYLWKKYWKDELAQYLNNFLEEAKKNENLKNLLNREDKNSIFWVIRYGIKEYARLLNISDKNPQLQYTWDSVFDMQIRSYLFLYWLVAYPDKFTPEKWFDDNELWEILKSILKIDWVIEDDWKDDRGYMESEKKLQKIQIVKDATRRKESRTRINSMQRSKQDFEWLWLKDSDDKKLDIQNATWVEIVQNKHLWSQISGFDRKEISSEAEDLRIQKITLMRTWKAFIRENQSVLSNYLDIRDVSMFFTVWKNWVFFNNESWEIFKNKWIKDNPGSDFNELDKVWSVLQTFPNKYQENLKKAWEFINQKKDQTHEIIKDYALGAVIDNIKDMFQNIMDTNNTWIFMNGFEFNEKETAKIEKNCLLLSGKFNWETMNIKYDLNTWKLYMNSFINESPGKIIIWGTNPEYEIWELRSFDTILDDFYNNPTETISDDIFSVTRNTSMTRNNQNNTSSEQQWSETPNPQIKYKISEFRNKIKEEHKIRFQRMCWTKLDEISWKIKSKVEIKSKCEPVAINLLRTLWIMPEDNDTINLIWWSDLYKTIQLVINSKNSADDISSFSNYMQKFMVFIWLDWWKNNSHQDQTGEISKIIFNENNKQEYISYVRDNTKIFDKEYLVATDKNKAQFDGNNFWILKIIEENFTSGEYPNWRLNYQKINEFEKNLNTEISNIQYNKNVAQIEKKEAEDNEANLEEALNFI